MFDVKKRRAKDFYTNIETKLQQKAEIRSIFSSRISKRKKTTEKKPKCLTTTLGTSVSAMFSSLFLYFSFGKQSYKNHNGIYRTHTTSGNWKYLKLMGFKLVVIGRLKRWSNIAWNIFLCHQTQTRVHRSIARINGERTEKKKIFQVHVKAPSDDDGDTRNMWTQTPAEAVFKLWNFHASVGS